MTNSKRNELSLQNHLIDSYKKAGGYAKKWASELTVGNPDLICTLPSVPVHLIECKHRPHWRNDDGDTKKNPLTPKQKSEARKWIKGGGIALGAVFTDSSNALGSWVVIFNPLMDEICLHECRAVPYEAGKKYDVIKLELGSVI